MSYDISYKNLLNYLEFSHYTKGEMDLPEHIGKVIHKERCDFVEYDENRQGITLRRYTVYRNGKLAHRVHELFKEEVSAAMFYSPENSGIMVTTPSKRLSKIIKDDISEWENTEVMVLYNLYNTLHSFNPKVISLDEYREQKKSTKAL